MTYTWKGQNKEEGKKNYTGCVEYRVRIFFNRMKEDFIAKREPLSTY